MRKTTQYRQKISEAKKAIIAEPENRFELAKKYLVQICREKDEELMAGTIPLTDGNIIMRDIIRFSIWIDELEK